MRIGDSVRVKEGRDTPAALQKAVATVIRIDELSVWVEHHDKTYVLDRSQLRRA